MNNLFSKTPHIHNLLKIMIYVVFHPHIHIDVLIIISVLL